jgi:hypothetical protein
MNTLASATVVSCKHKKLTNLLQMLAVVYDTFTRIEKEKFRRLFLHKRKAAQHAFRLLVTNVIDLFFLRRSQQKARVSLACENRNLIYIECSIGVSSHFGC